jgi:thymidine kinase
MSYLELFIGPMYSGKTSTLIQLYKKYTFCNISVLVINHCDDIRYHNSMLSTHDKIMVPCIQTIKIKDILDSEEYKKAEVILINEAQFYPDLYNGVVEMLNDEKKIYVSGLDGDFKRNKFGQILDLIPLCDKVSKMSALCGLCKNGTHAIYSLRLSENKQQMLIGSDIYIPVCRKCYDNPITYIV